jgi:hypothetical protein
MKLYFELDSKEKKQELLLLAFAICGFLIIAKGIYNEFYKIDQNYILVPLVMIMFGGYFLVYAINGLTLANLTPKWTPFYLFQLVFILTKTIGATTPDKARRFSSKFLGALALIISIGCFSLAFIQFVR